MLDHLRGRQQDACLPCCRAIRQCPSKAEVRRRYRLRAGVIECGEPVAHFRQSARTNREYTFVKREVVTYVSFRLLKELKALSSFSSFPSFSAFSVRKTAMFCEIGLFILQVLG